MSAYSELLDYYVERYNAGDLDAVMDLYAEDAVQIMPEGTFEGGGPGAGRRRQDQPADRPGAVHHPQDRKHPRLKDPGQARGGRSRRGSCGRPPARPRQAMIRRRPAK